MHTYIIVHTYILKKIHTYIHTYICTRINTHTNMDVPDYYQPKQHVWQATHFNITNTFQLKRPDNLTVRYILLVKDWEYRIIKNIRKVVHSTSKHFEWNGFSTESAALNTFLVKRNLRIIWGHCFVWPISYVTSRQYSMCVRAIA